MGAPVADGFTLQLRPWCVDWQPLETIFDKHGANPRARMGRQTDSGPSIAVRQSNYLNNLVEQKLDAVKRITRPMLDFKSLGCARTRLAGIEVMHMIRNGEVDYIKDGG